jgi:hypothetical protein
MRVRNIDKIGMSDTAMARLPKFVLGRICRHYG